MLFFLPPRPGSVHFLLGATPAELQEKPKTGILLSTVLVALTPKLLELGAGL